MQTAPRHPVRLQEAAEFGEVAGREYQTVADQHCDPGEWTEEKRAQWCGLLRQIEVNPYTPDQFPHEDATDEQNAKYADTWARAFVVGRHAVQAENRRAAA